jgi:YYY domain-containing protein
MTDLEATARWLIAITIMTFACAPLLWWLGRGLGPSVHGIIRALGLVVVTALLWWPAAVLDVPYRPITLIVVIIAVGIIGWALWIRSSETMNWRALASFEGLWLALFAGYILFRAYQPDIANTEKPMEIALLSSVSRSSSVPAPDPWFAGEAINYYYFGYQMFASVVKLTGVPTAVAFNLALATLFASVGTVAAAVGHRIATSVGLSRGTAVVAGGLATLFVLLAGNLEAAWRLVRDPAETLEQRFWYEGVGWQASRIIVDHGVHGHPGPRGTINEFPAFSFVLGDLHPHLTTYPLLLGIVALVIGLVCSPATIVPLRLAVTGALIGLLYVSNSWDAPLGLLFLAGGMFVALGLRARRTWIALVIALLTAFIAALPFVLHFTPPVGVTQTDIPNFVRSVPLLSTLVGTIGVVTWRPSGIGELLIVHGHWIVAWALFAVYVDRREARLRESMRRYMIPLAAALVIVALIAILWAPGLLLLGVPLAVSIGIVVTSHTPPIRLVAGLFATGFFLTLVPEFLYIQDAFGDRMNTVFKLYFQAWLFFGLATASAFAVAASAASRSLSVAAVTSAVVLLMIVAPYTPISARDWTDGFQTRHGIDGGSYVGRRAPDDYAAIQWLIDNAPADATLIEGPGCSYQTVGGVPMNRVSAFSGVPTALGWAGHQRQWRRGEDPPLEPRLNQREEFVNSWLEGSPAQLATTPTPSYIFLGSQERAGSATCDSLEGHDTDRTRALLETLGWRIQFESGSTLILVNPDLPEYVANGIEGS